MQNLNRNVIKFEKITPTDKELIANAFLPLIKNYFKDKNVMKEYKKWQRKRLKK